MPTEEAYPVTHLHAHTKRICQESQPERLSSRFQLRSLSDPDSHLPVSRFQPLGDLWLISYINLDNYILQIVLPLSAKSENWF